MDLTYEPKEDFRMSTSRRGHLSRTRSTLRVAMSLAVAGVLLAGCTGKGPVADGGGGGAAAGAPASPSPSPLPSKCPLTGLAPKSGTVPNRPVLAVKVENLPQARPQTGLSWADIVYEEPVEANITRFIVVYQCQDAGRIEPVRSARLTDPDILVQFGKPLFGFAGGVQRVLDRVHERGLIDVNVESRAASQSYHRDPARSAPHNLYTSTRELYGDVKTSAGPPKPIFAYSTDVPPAARTIHSIHVPFSIYADVFWKWSASKGAYLRYYGTVPANLSDGTQISATNVVVQIVKVTLTDITDANGVHSPEVTSVGTGKVYVFRDGKMITGTWQRNSLGDVTKLLDASGNVIPLAPGKTWVELLPVGDQVGTS
jgi:hypothetical protein